MQGEELAGLITLSDIRHISRNEWAHTPVGLAITSLDRLHTVTSQQSLNEVLPLMVNWDMNQVPVVDDGRLTGVLSREDIMRFLEIRHGLGLDEGSK